MICSCKRFSLEAIIIKNTYTHMHRVFHILQYLNISFNETILLLHSRGRDLMKDTMSMIELHNQVVYKFAVAAISLPALNYNIKLG
jgi:hypothetical protein